MFVARSYESYCLINRFSLAALRYFTATWCNNYKRYNARGQQVLLQYTLSQIRRLRNTNRSTLSAL